ncbi:hypothetical protein BU15DRAFT_79397 [Melanogaster broomeanus]|nr:hypothetical protein BU15DRAFT_79397 [Melanogaster broomeanus]
MFPLHAIAVKLLARLSHILNAFPRSRDGFLRASSVLVQVLYNNLKKLLAASSKASPLQSQTHCASFIPTSACPPQAVIQPAPLVDGNNTVSASSNNPVGNGQQAEGDHVASPSGTQAKPTSQFPPSVDPKTPSTSTLNVPARLSTPLPSLHSGSGNVTGRVLRPGAPEEIMERRYKQRIKVERNHAEVLLNPGDMNYDDTDIPGWVQYTQPEGSSYFANLTRRIITDADICRPNLLNKINEVANSLLLSAERMSAVHDKVELVIGLIDHGAGNRECLYYFVDHQRQLLFWVHAYPLSNIFANVKGVNKKSHMKYAIETQYWTHLELYPNGRTLKAEHHTELKGILIHASTETLTSNTSIAPFDSDELSRMLDLMDKTEGSIGQEQVHAVYVVARLMRLFTSSKFVNFYGQPGARLNADQSVYTKLRGQDQATSLLIRISDLILFRGPSAHVSELQRMWVDRSVNAPRWKGFISKLSNEWAGFTIYSTVMLAVDVSFLAIPALDPTKPNGKESLAASIATYMSIILVVGSLVVSVQLSNRIRGQENASAKEAAAIMLRSTQSMLGTDALAIMYSLPFALLIWGMLFFVVALAFVVFGSQDNITLGTITPGVIIVGFLTAWPSWGNRGNYITLHKLWTNGVKSVTLFNRPREPMV